MRFERARWSLWPLTSKVVVQGIAKVLFNKGYGLSGVMHTVKGSLELELKARRVFKLLEKL